MLQEILDCLGYINTIIKTYDKWKLKNAFADEIRFEMSALEEAYSSLLINFYLIFGATIIGAVFPPRTPEVTINNIVGSYTNSIIKLETSIIQLVKTLKIHEADLYKLIGNDYSTKMFMENLVASTNIEEKTIDWEYLSHKNKIIHVDLKNINNTNFPMELNEALKPLTEELKINNIMWDDISYKNIEMIEKLWLNKDFRRKFLKLVKEYSD